MSKTIKEIEPFTYWRDSSGQRGFLLVDIHEGEFFGDKVVMIEFGKTRSNPTYTPIPKFMDLINTNKLIPFTPKIK